LTANVKLAPVPESGTTSGLEPPLLTIVRVPDCKPLAEGAKVTTTLQLPPAGSDAAQLLVELNSALVVILEIVSELVPMLVTTIVWAAVVLVTVVAGKTSAVGSNCRLGCMPVPERAIAGTSELPENEMAPFCKPGTVGAN
jgi:hypothetical protein